MIDPIANWLRTWSDGDTTAAATILIAVFTLILAWIAFRQGRDSRVLHRAYIGVKPAGIHLWSTGGDLLSHVVIQNAGNLPANDIRWVISIQVDGKADRSWFPIDERKLTGDHYIPPKGEMTVGSPRIGLQSVLDARDGDAPHCYLYVWGVVHYRDGFKKRRRIAFCHRYNYRQTRDLMAGNYELSGDKGRYHQWGNRADY